MCFGARQNPSYLNVGLWLIVHYGPAPLARVASTDCTFLAGLEVFEMGSLGSRRGVEGAASLSLLRRYAFTWIQTVGQSRRSCER